MAKRFPENQTQSLIVARGRTTQLSIPAPARPYLHHLAQLLAAETHFDRSQPHLALSAYLSLPSTPQTLFNIAQIHLYVFSLTAAHEYFRRAVEIDVFFVVGWLMLGHVAFEQRRFKDAEASFAEALRRMRGGARVEYEQLGLAYTVRREQVLWNRALARRAEGGRCWCVPAGGLFRVDARKMTGEVRERVVGEGTGWGFLGVGRVVAIGEEEPETGRKFKWWRRKKEG